jgi:rubrerythrin
MKPDQQSARRHWRLEDINYSGVDRAAIAGNDQLFYLVVSASFVEILADLYTANLGQRYSDDAAASGWLNEQWRVEEIQHGDALKAYAQAAWPDFDWERAYQGFAAEYGAMCTMEELEPHRGLEMAARCVVEIGTATLYNGIERSTNEPVLRDLASRIKQDEVRHYKQFQKLYKQYRESEALGFWAIARAVFKRIAEARGEDSNIAFKHAYLGRHPGAEAAEIEAAWQAFNKSLGPWARNFYPYHMAVAMLLALLPMPEILRRSAKRPLEGVARMMMFG